MASTKASSASKPTLLLVTGSFALPRFYNPTTDILPSHVQIEIPHLRTVGTGTDTGRPGPAPSMYEDAEFILSHLQRLIVEQGKDVILVAHSYGGVPSTEVLGLAKEKGLIKSDRQAKGESGGVVRVAYMTVLVPEMGGNAMGMLAEVREEHRMDFAVDESGWMYHTNLKRTAAICANHMSAEERQPWFDQFPRHSAPCFADALRHEGWRHVPISYLVAEDDLCIPADVQKAEIERFEKAGCKVDVKSVKVDHVLNVSAPKVLADWWTELVEKS